MLKAKLYAVEQFVCPFGLSINSMFVIITDLELKLRDSEIMEEDDDSSKDGKDEKIDESNLYTGAKKKKEKKRAHKQEKDEEECTRESFKKMKEEIDEMRKREIARSKELNDLKRKVEEQSKSSADSFDLEYDLEFDRETYLSKGFVESAKWIKDVVAKNLLEKLNQAHNRLRFEAVLSSKKVSNHMGIRTCARFNRGEICHFGKIHSSHRPDSWNSQGTNSSSSKNTETYGDYKERRSKDQMSVQERLGKKNELRIHACTLCMEAFGSANGHSVFYCPWILKKNWPTS